MEPTEQQQRVIDSDAKDILVEAGAGSGKTTTTVKRYVRLLEGGYEAREILAFTFTDKAAGELRDKVRKARRELAVKRGEDNPQAFSMSDAWVGTFHAICNRILKAYPVEAGVDPGFSVIDDVTSETVRSEAFSLALTAFRKEDESDGGRERLIGLFTEKALREAVSGGYDELRSRGVMRPRLPDFENTLYPADTISWLKTRAPGLVEMKGLSAKQKSQVLGMVRLFEERQGNPVTASEIAPFRMKAGKNEDLHEFIAAIDEALERLVAHESGDDARRGIARLLELFSERYSELKARRSVLDYEDLQLLTLDLLRRSPMIRDWYRDRFREIMVDEFQDTNQLQLDLVMQLRGEDTTLMTVGDEMQSIYGFRHADVELFRARRNDPNVTPLYLTDNFRSLPDVIGAVNEIGHRLDRQVSDKRGDDTKGRHEFTELTIGRPGDGEPSSARLILTGPKDWKTLELGDMAPAIPEEAEVGKEQDHHHEAEALAVAHELRKLVDEGLAKQSEIVILLRAKTRTDIYVNALRQVGLSPYLVAGAGFWDSREAVELRALLGTIANPLDDESLIATLTSPACGLSSNALWLLRKGGPDYEPLWPTLQAVALGNPVDAENSTLLEAIPAEDRERIVKFEQVMTGLRGSSVTTPLDSLIEEAVAATGYDLATLVRDPSRNGMANVRRLASLALEYELAEARDLRGFLDWVALSAGLDSEASSATQEEDSEVIRIMTVHAAKGLEFKVACIPDCGRSVTNRHNSRLIFGRSTNPDDPMDFKVGLSMPAIDRDSVGIHDWNELDEAAKLANEDEELRLFHVAMTRAEDHLVIGGVIPGKNQDEVTDAASMVNRVTQAFDIRPREPESWPPVVPGGPEPDAAIQVIPNMASAERAEFLSSTADSLEAKTPPRAGEAPLSRPAVEVFPNVPLSFTALNAFTECPTRFYARRILHLREPTEPDDAGFEGHEDGVEVDPGQESLFRRDRATAFGSAVHDVLETLGKRKWPAVKEDQIIRALLRRGADPEEDLARATKMISSFTDSDLGQRVIAGRASFEEPLLVRVERITVRGFADLILEGEIPMVLDYKTNFLGDESPVEKMSDYSLQRDLYALAVARSRGLTEVETAYVFLEKPGEPVIEVMDSARLDQAVLDLGKSLKEITSSHFFGGPEAEFPPCGKCWACDALRTQRDRASARAFAA